MKNNFRVNFSISAIAIKKIRFTEMIVSKEPAFAALSHNGLFFKVIG